MPKINVNREPEAKPGKHVMTLVGVETVITANPFAKKDDGSMDEEATRERFVWKFESDTKDVEGTPLTYKVWTNTSYGNEKASLTAFLNLMIPGLAGKSKGDASDFVRYNLNTDDLIGQRFNVILREQKGKKSTFIGHTDIEPRLMPDGSVERTFVTEDGHAVLPGESQPIPN